MASRLESKIQITENSIEAVSKIHIKIKIFVSIFETIFKTIPRGLFRPLGIERKVKIHQIKGTREKL